MKGHLPRVRSGCSGSAQAGRAFVGFLEQPAFFQGLHCPCSLSLEPSLSSWCYGISADTKEVSPACSVQGRAPRISATKTKGAAAAFSLARPCLSLNPATNNMGSSSSLKTPAGRRPLDTTFNFNLLLKKKNLTDKQSNRRIQVNYIYTQSSPKRTASKI